MEPMMEAIEDWMAKKQVEQEKMAKTVKERLKKEKLMKKQQKGLAMLNSLMRERTKL